ncbi:MAG: hypothetical protein GEV06_09980 [Luteitalea sp.]|nr:hypothetical protein [Luteitalea sp.]
MSSVPVPDAVGSPLRLAIETARRAEAMGLGRTADVVPFDAAGLQRLARRIERAGIARDAARALANVEEPTPAELAELLTMVIAALEASPAPVYEWKAISAVFDSEQLASLLGVSFSSLRRYQSGARTTPDEVAARLHWLALIVGDLAGTYNEIGIRRWFDRRRTALDGKSPASLLRGAWAPEDPGPQRVRALAQSLVSLAST